MNRSIKVFEGFSCCFRQWKAIGTHCSKIHGYAVSFRVVFEGDLDEKNWVFDFGGMKRSTTLIDGKNAKDWMNYMFDHTTIISEDDPYLEYFKKAHKLKILELRILPDSGAERFAEFLFKKLSEFVLVETKERVKIVSVEFIENNKNSAIYQLNK